VLFLKLTEEMIAVHIIVYVDYLPVSEIDSVSIDVLVVSMINESHLRWDFHFTFKDGDVITCVVISVAVVTVFCLEFTYIFKANCDSQEHSHR
jgi:hypothetical protein